MENKKNILITGAAGMIAWHTIQALSIFCNEYNIIGIDKYDMNSSQFFKQRLTSLSHIKNFSIIHDDLCYGNKLEEIILSNNISAIIHLAANANVSESYSNPEKVLSNNYNSFLSVLKTVQKHQSNIPIIYASTSSVYGNCENKTNENSPLNPVSSYGLSKLQNEQIAEIYHQQYGLNLIGLRFFTIYGEYNRTDMFIYKLLKSIHEGSPLSLYHNGKMKRDFTYCGDIADILVKAFKYIINNEPNHLILNVGTSHPVTTLEIVNLLENYFNKKANINLIKEHPSYDPLLTYCDNTKISELFNIKKMTSIEEGLLKTSQWYKNLFY